MSDAEFQLGGSIAGVKILEREWSGNDGFVRVPPNGGGVIAAILLGGYVTWALLDAARVWPSTTVLQQLAASLILMPAVLALGLRASLLVNGGNYHGAESVYGVDNPRLNYSAVAADLGARWFLRSLLHVTVHGGYTLYRRFEFTQGRDPVPGGEYELTNGPMFGVDLGVGG